MKKLNLQCTVYIILIFTGQFFLKQFYVNLRDITLRHFTAIYHLVDVYGIVGMVSLGNYNTTLSEHSDIIEKNLYFCKAI